MRQQKPILMTKQWQYFSPSSEESGKIVDAKIPVKPKQMLNEQERNLMDRIEDGKLFIGTALIHVDKNDQSQVWSLNPQDAMNKVKTSPMPEFPASVLSITAAEMNTPANANTYITKFLFK